MNKRKKRSKKLACIIGLCIVMSFALAIGLQVLLSKKENSNKEEQAVKETKEESVKEETEEIELYQRIAMETTELAESIQLDVPMIYQKPELPTGCEITSLAMVLNYYGYEIDKCQLSDEYLDKGPTFETNPYKAFMGEPRSVHSYGCYAPVIVNAANKYLATVGFELRPYDASGKEFEELLPYLNHNIPVIVWETIGMKEAYATSTFTVDGETVEGMTNEHCMVLIGYNQEGYIMADPLAGIKVYDKSIVEQRYEDMNRQAVIIM